jgi:putative flippase GtrA
MNARKLLNLSFVRFLMVGVLNTIVGLGCIFLLLNAAGLNYWLSTFLGNSIGALVSYVLNKRFTFRSNARVASSLWRFFAVILVCYFLSYGIGLYGGTALTAIVPAIPGEWAHNIAVLFGSGLYTVLNYLGQKYFAFRPSAQSRQAGEIS